MILRVLNIQKILKSFNFLWSCIILAWSWQIFNLFIANLIRIINPYDSWWRFKSHWIKANRRFAFYLCFLNPPQEAHRSKIKILFIRSCRRTWSNGKVVVSQTAGSSQVWINYISIIIYIKPHFASLSLVNSLLVFAITKANKIELELRRFIVCQFFIQSLSSLILLFIRCEFCSLCSDYALIPCQGLQRLNHGKCDFD